jgi:bacillithiol biosynthesis cysteine-adding enzyme BshC
MGTAFSSAFLNGESRAVVMLPDSFRRAADRARCVERATRRSTPPAVLEALRADAQSPRQRTNLERLAEQGTAAVVTGQQVGLFLGPLYTLYKAASAVVTARALEAETQRPVVPIFWLQSEDHDFDEVSTCWVWASDGTLQRCSLVADASRARCSIGSIQLGGGIEAALESLAGQLDSLPRAEHVFSLLKTHYRAPATWVEAFAGVLQALFAETGLLVIDPRRLASTPAVRQLHHWAFRDRAALGQRLVERHTELAHAGFETQVHIRQHAPLFFFHPDGADGPRFRLEEAAEAFHLVGSTEGPVTSETVNEALERAPSAFSTSALLRPVLQDTLFPTCATIVGPGELNYFAQLEPLYRSLGLDLPMVVPRARFRVIDARTAAHLSHLGLSAERVEAGESSAGTSIGFDESAIVDDLLAAFDARVARVPSQEHHDVARALRRTRGTVERAAQRLAGRVARALRTRDEVARSRLERVRNVLLPHGEPQERVWSWPSVAARTGIDEFTHQLLGAITPFAPDLKTLSI